MWYVLLQSFMMGFMGCGFISGWQELAVHSPIDGFQEVWLHFWMARVGCAFSYRWVSGGVASFLDGKSRLCIQCSCVQNTCY